MNGKAALILILFILIIAAVPAVAHGSTVNGVILRANVNEMYIENQPIPVQVQALYFVNSVPHPHRLRWTSP